MTVRIKENSKNKKVFILLSKSEENAKKGGRVGLFRIGQLLTDVARAGIKNQPKTGEYYKYKGRRKRASAPGQYPANRSGELRRSIDFRVDGNSRMIFGAGKEYGKFLEEGTRNMEPRPFLKKTVKKMESTNKQILIKAFDEEMKRG